MNYKPAQQSTLSKEKVMEVFEQHQIDVMRMSREEISEGNLMSLTNKHIAALCSLTVPTQPLNERYKEIIKSEWFQKAYGNKSLGEIMEMETVPTLSEGEIEEIITIYANLQANEFGSDSIDTGRGNKSYLKLMTKKIKAALKELNK